METREEGRADGFPMAFWRSRQDRGHHAGADPPGQVLVLLVTHDEEDGAWQFLDGGHVFEDDGEVIYLGEMVQFDPSLGQLGDLPAGWYASRRNRGRPWRRAQGEPPVTPDRREDGSAAEGPPGATEHRDRGTRPGSRCLRQGRRSISDSAVEVLDQEDIFFAAPEAG